jgi:hypothetical protein
MEEYRFSLIVKKSLLLDQKEDGFMTNLANDREPIKHFCSWKKTKWLERIFKHRRWTWAEK